VSLDVRAIRLDLSVPISDGNFGLLRSDFCFDRATDEELLGGTDF
jgi:hypothetical protein